MCQHRAYADDSNLIVIMALSRYRQIFTYSFYRQKSTDFCLAAQLHARRLAVKGAAAQRCEAPLTDRWIECYLTPCFQLLLERSSLWPFPK